MKTAWDLLDLLGSEAGDCFVILDEVQELSSNAGALLKLLGNIFNTRPNVVFAFTGSLVGLSRTLIEPSATSPLYGRSPVAISLKPFDRSTSEEFLARGAAEAGVRLSPRDIETAVQGPLDGTPGWLTLFGNHLTVQKLPPDRALRETIREGKQAAESELAQFLATREATLYWPALKAMSTGCTWGTVRDYVGRATGVTPNDGSVLRIIRALESSFLARQEDGRYVIPDPMMRTYLIEARRLPRLQRGTRRSGPH